MTLYDFHAKTIDGKDQPFEAFRGRVLLVVNVASQCAFTKQYAGLEELYQRHKEAGLTVLGFPCDQFGHQEPGNEADIVQFCSLKYNVTFPMFAKIEVNGAGTHPLYQFLKSARRGLLGTTSIKWNFTKFLVSRSGDVVGRYPPTTGPAGMEKDVLPLLAEKQAV